MNLENVNFPKKIDKYQIIEELGRGGMGCVYKAFDPHMDKFVALKVLLRHTDQKQKQRFIREAKAMAKIDHPNIIKIYTVGKDGDCPFLIMDYIEGSTLGEFLKSMEINSRLFSQIMMKIGKAIAYTHERGIIHRDLKPGNILLDKNGVPYVMDFGLAKLTQEESLTQKGAIMGTPQYMSPEQAMGKKVNHLADLYALGAIFYEMLAAKPLVQGRSVAHIMFNVIHEKPTPLRQVNNEIAVDLETICHKAIAKQPEERYQSVSEFSVDIERFLNGETISTKTLSIKERFYKKAHTNKLVVITTIAGILLAMLGVWIFEKKQTLEVYQYLAKAKEWRQKAAVQSAVEKKMELYMKVSSFLEKALEISPKNFIVKC